MTVRLVVTGSESTGKTTLARELAAVLRAAWIPEYAREYAAARGGTLTADDVEPIARGQVEREDAALAATGGRGVLVFDTDIVSTTVYAEHYYGSCPPWIAAAARARRADLYLLCLPDLPWEADGVRDQPMAREAVHARFVDRLQELGAVVLPVQGRGDARRQVALAAVRGWRAAVA